jgi:hypothetical protein
VRAWLASRLRLWKSNAAPFLSPVMLNQRSHICLSTSQETPGAGWFSNPESPSGNFRHFPLNPCLFQNLLFFAKNSVAKFAREHSG